MLNRISCKLTPLLRQITSRESNWSTNSPKHRAMSRITRKSTNTSSANLKLNTRRALAISKLRGSISNIQRKRLKSWRTKSLNLRPITRRKLATWRISLVVRTICILKHFMTILHRLISSRSNWARRRLRSRVLKLPINNRLINSKRRFLVNNTKRLKRNLNTIRKCEGSERHPKLILKSYRANWNNKNKLWAKTWPMRKRRRKR